MSIELLNDPTAPFLGRLGETVWKHVISGSGFLYVSLCEIAERGAPMARGSNQNIVLPDFEAMNGGRCFCLDSKCKARNVLYRKRNELRHGIDRRNFEQYVAFGAVSNRHCGIGIVELKDGRTERWSGSLMLGMFSLIGSPLSGFSNQEHMVYWPVRRFTEVARFSKQELWDCYVGRLQYDASEAINSCLDQLPERPIQPAKQGELW